jgi:single-strand DNA-binding protein
MPPKNAVAWSWSSGSAFIAQAKRAERKDFLNMDLNQISLLGYVGSDARVSSTTNGTQVTSFSVAVNKNWTDENGTRQSKTQWVNVTGYGKWPATIASRLVKGAHIFVQGELMTREYLKTIEVAFGKKKVEAQVKQLSVEIRPESILLLDRRPDTESSQEEIE